MERDEDVFVKSKAVQDMHHLRLMSLLQELERDHGRKKAAALLGVDRRTLDASLDDGVLSRRMRGVLDKALQYGMGSAAAEQRDRNEKLEDRLGELEGIVGELGKECRAGRRAWEDAFRAGRDEEAQERRKLERALAKLAAQGGAQGGPEAERLRLTVRGKRRAQARVPRPGDPRTRSRRRGGVRRGVAPDRRMAGAEGDPPQPGKEPVVAGGGGAFHDGGADAVGGARDDAASGEVSTAGLRPERSGQLAQDSALRHAESAEKA